MVRRLFETYNRGDYAAAAACLAPGVVYEVGQELQREEIHPKLHIFRNPVNLMYGGNQRRGYQYAIEPGSTWS